ncbi:MAG: hypothetical protein WD557_16370 [Dehalococcoidia bacterium]
MVMQGKRRVWTLEEYRGREPKGAAELVRAREATAAFLVAAAAARLKQPDASLTRDEFQELLEHLDDED